MNKTLTISGMSCGHCAARVEKALNKLEGVDAKVDLKKHTAKLEMSREISDEELKQVIDDTGYELVEITND